MEGKKEEFWRRHGRLGNIAPRYCGGAARFVRVNETNATILFQRGEKRFSSDKACPTQAQKNKIRVV